MTRRRFSETDVLATLVWQGVELNCYRCQRPLFFRVTVDSKLYGIKPLGEIQREHLHEVALGGPDEPSNCRYSHKECHSIVTNGTPATSAGSSKNRIAKARPARAEELLAHKIPLDADLVGEPVSRCKRCGEYNDTCTCASPQRRTAFGGRR